jgi:serine/threonine-protein kinase
LAACPTCSNSAPDGSRFCPFCGGKLAALVRKPQDPLVGKVIDNKYVVLERIGTGAMGSIYKAEHRALSKQIALKVLHRHLLTEESHVKRFHREAKAASRLNHPNAIAMLDFGQTEDGLSYIAMEFLPGRDLCRVLFDEGRFSDERTIRISAQILDALDEAHAAGVIHRDLKPENIMIEKLRSNPDFVKVLDFGIAKIRDFAGSENSSFKTATGMVFGTPEYMSPEQIRGEELDGRSDLYSLGVLIYQMLSGELPFSGDSVLEVATAHLTQPPIPLVEKVPGINPAVAAVVSKLMAKKRDDRFENAAEARNAMMAASENAVRPVPPGRKSEQRPQQAPEARINASPSSPESRLGPTARSAHDDDVAPAFLTEVNPPVNSNVQIVKVVLMIALVAALVAGIAAWFWMSYGQ